MKKLMGVLVFFLAVYTQAYAADFNYTGMTAQAINGPQIWFGGYASLGPLGYGPLGGPAGDDIFGIAQQFTVTQETPISSLNVQAQALPEIAGTTTFHYSLYTDSTFTSGGTVQTKPIPVASSLVKTSQPISITMTQDQVNSSSKPVSYSQQVPFDYTLNPGTYWIAEEGGGGTYVYVQQSYVDPPPSGDGSGDNTAHAPEPAMWMMLGGFLLFVLFNGKRYVAMESMV